MALQRLTTIARDTLSRAKKNRGDSESLEFYCGRDCESRRSGADQADFATWERLWYNKAYYSEVGGFVAIVLTYHARERITQRGISESMIEEAILTPDATGEGYSGKLLAFKRFPKGLLKVVYFVDGNNHVIVSTIWED